MGVYFQTRFYPNMSDTSRYTVLATVDRVLDFHDMERGWVRAEELLRVYKDKVAATDLTTNSWVVEFMTPTHEVDSVALQEVRRLPVY
jgi:hypothetical protein